MKRDEVAEQVFNDSDNLTSSFFDHLALVGVIRNYPTSFAMIVVAQALSKEAYTLHSINKITKAEAMQKIVCLAWEMLNIYDEDNKKNLH